MHNGELFKEESKIKNKKNPAALYKMISSGSTGKGLGAERQPRKTHIVILFRRASKTGELICGAASWMAAVLGEGRG